MRLPLLIALTVLSGCVPDDGVSLFFRGARPPDPENDCSYGVGNEFLIRGSFNAAVGQQYVLGAQFQNQVLARPLTSPTGADPNAIQLKNAEIKLLDGGDQSTLAFAGGLPNPFSVTLAGGISPAAGPSSPTEVVLGIEIIPPRYAAELATRAAGGMLLVIASVKVHGETTGGIDVDAGEFLWPIDVGAGNYLFRCVTDELDQVLACLPGQDAYSFIVATTADTLMIDGLCE